MQGIQVADRDAQDDLKGELLETIRTRAKAKDGIQNPLREGSDQHGGHGGSTPGMEFKIATRRATKAAMQNPDRQKEQMQGDTCHIVRTAHSV